MVLLTDPYIGPAARAEWERQRRQSIAGQQIQGLLSNIEANIAANAARLQDPSQAMDVAMGFTGTTIPVGAAQRAAAGYMPRVLQRGPGGRPIQRAGLPSEAARKALLEAQMMKTGQRGLLAYHGSPHRFERFADEAIGTGEGAQAYGYGHYFAEKPGVAQTYKPTEGARILELTEEANVRLPTWISGRIKHGGPRAAQEMADDFSNRVAEAEAKVAAKSGQWWIDKGNLPNLRAIRDDLQFLAKQPEIGTAPRGHMYQVGLRTKAEDLLDWDKPLSQQPAKVREGLKKAGFDVSDESIKPSFYGLRDPAQTERLRRAGIKGIRYLDQASRAEGKGTYNYVMFDPEDVRILERYGIAGGLLADED